MRPLLSKSTFIDTSTSEFWSGSTEMAEDANFVNQGKVRGTVTFKGNFANEANLSPGSSPGTCTVQGNYTAASYACHNFEVEGIMPGTYDLLQVTGIVNLGGSMNITLKLGVNISGSTEIPIIIGKINGTFSSTSLPDGLMLDYKTNSLVLKAVTPLPCIFVNLEARRQPGGVQLTWKVADENGVLHYEIEKAQMVAGFLKWEMCRPL